MSEEKSFPIDLESESKKLRLSFCQTDFFYPDSTTIDIHDKFQTKDFTVAKNRYYTHNFL